MSDEFLVLVCLLVWCLFFAITGAWVYLLWKRIAGIGTPEGVCIIGFWGANAIPPLCWIMALVMPGQDLRSPSMLGIGGAAYGLDYSVFPVTLLFWGGALVLGLTISHLMVKSISGKPAGFIKPAKPAAVLGLINKLDSVPFLFAVVLFFLFFSIVGWDRLYYSSAGRFESTSNAESFVPMTMFLPLLIMVACASSFYVSTGRSVFMNIVAAVIASIPFLVLASRGFSVCIAALLVSLCSRFRFKWYVVLVSFILVLWSLWVPLATRSQDTGLLVFFRLHADLLSSNGPSIDLSEVFICLFQNIGQGFGVQVETFSPNNNGDPVFEIPAMYWILSFSPTLSLMDNFSGKWLLFHPRLNGYTPYGVMPELFLLCGWFSVVAGPLLLGLYLCIISCARKFFRIGGVFLLSASFLYLAALMQAQQYPTRTVGRFVYLGILLIFVGAIFRSPAKTTSRLFKS